MQLLCPVHLQWLQVTLPHHWQADNLGPGRLLTTLSESCVEPGLSSIMKKGLLINWVIHSCIIVCFLDNQSFLITANYSLYAY